MPLREISQLLYQMKLIDQKVGKIFEEKMGFSLTRYEMLMVLKEKGPCLQVTIQEHLQIDQAAITRHLKILEKNGYVTRERNPANNREIFVALKEKATAEMAKCETVHTGLQERLYASFSKDEVQELARLVGKFETSINEIIPK
ncbi:MarR family winged helix-turn-helix transcriptional regulator [Isobaculum melis]|uniref:DNA-binding transcriptional regulator, MarR family n=1 Tax=Isobaculum melis TaxID=142588 RepID=A0A1H9SDI6_9LACT|nr:MarR family winged helix-turn-helix transcriptional regulator [Isobaculum melis]SER82433.1 DNA-binding transcriptional regulator, MarR family [Isobaculum melis]